MMIGGVKIGGDTFKPNWREDTDGYLRGLWGCGSSATEKRERQRKRELEKSASRTRSNKNKPNNTDSTPDAL